MMKITISFFLLSRPQTTGIFLNSLLQKMKITSAFLRKQAPNHLPFFQQHLGSCCRVQTFLTARTVGYSRIFFHFEQSGVFLQRPSVFLANWAHDENNSKLLEYLLMKTERLPSVTLISSQCALSEHPVVGVPVVKLPFPLNFKFHLKLLKKILKLRLSLKKISSDDIIDKVEEI